MEDDFFCPANISLKCWLHFCNWKF